MRRSGRRTNESAPEPRFLRLRRASNRRRAYGREPDPQRNDLQRPNFRSGGVRRSIRLCRTDGRSSVRRRRRHASVQTIVPHPARTGGNRRAANTGQPLGRHAANRNDLQIIHRPSGRSENPPGFFEIRIGPPYTGYAARRGFFDNFTHMDFRRYRSNDTD